MQNFNPALCRDVALKKLTSHDDLEKHCHSTYNKLTENQTTGISVPLVLTLHYIIPKQ
jgi:hypothetical protein